jgi:hypothetical protein
MIRTSLLLFMTIAVPLKAQPAPVDCVASGLIFVLGTGSQPEGEGFAYWASLSNPGLRTVHWRHRFGDGTPGPMQRLEASRQTRLALGHGAANLTPEEVARALVLRCLPH